MRAEWRRFFSHRRWVIGIAAAPLIIILLGLLFTKVFKIYCETPTSTECPPPILGPNGEVVNDRLYFVNQSLTGDGTITVRVTSMTGLITYPPPNHDEIVPGVVPWAKAGLMIKQSVEQGSAYAAIMLTGSHGVRMQYDYVEDIAGLPDGISAQSPRWLRLTRSGNTITGYESIDGDQWIEVGKVDLDGLPEIVQIGLFATSPCDLTFSQGACRFTQVAAVFDQVSLEGSASGTWSQNDIVLNLEPDGTPHHPGGLVEADGIFTVTGSGDIDPALFEGSIAVERTLIGTVIGLIAVIIVAARFGSVGYQQGGKVLAAKAVVIGTITFIAGLVAAVVVVQLGQPMLRANGNYILPVTPLTELRVEVGTAALIAAVAIFALALGALFRRSLPAVLAALALIVLPYLLSISFILPQAPSDWLMLLTPAAGFAIQQTLTEYPQVIGLYAPAAGYFPLSPWAGFAVLCGYAALAFIAAILPRREAQPTSTQIVQARSG